jgi:PAS domain-containing protein
MPFRRSLVQTAGWFERVWAGLASGRSSRRPSEADRKVGRDRGVGQGRRVRRASSSPRWSVSLVSRSLRARPRRCGRDRQIVRWYGTSTDIDALKQAEVKLREDERALRRITDAIPQTIVVQDPDGIPVYANQAVLDYTGLTMADILTSDFRARIFHPEDLKRVREPGGVPGLRATRRLRARSAGGGRGGRGGDPAQPGLRRGRADGTSDGRGGAQALVMTRFLEEEWRASRA